MELETIKRSMLFRNMDEEEIKQSLFAMDAEERTYQKDEIILCAGDTTDKMGLVLSGGVTIETVDPWGNRSILSHVGPGHLFAEVFALLEKEPILVDVQVSQACQIMFLRPKRIEGCTEPWSAKLMRNLLQISLNKNLNLSSRSYHTAPKTSRGRIMAYLSAMSIRAHSREFDIPFDRQQLADYLNLERSALSKELSKMRRDGLLEFRKNHFVLKE